MKMDRTLIKYGFIIAIVGIILLVVSLSELTSLSGFAGLSLAFSHPNAFRFQFVLFTLLEWWGVGMLVVGASAIFLSVYEIENISARNKFMKRAKVAVVAAFVIGLSFSGFSIYMTTASLHGKLAVTETSSGSTFTSTTNITVTYTASASGGEGPYNYSWTVAPSNFFDSIGYSSSGTHSSTLKVTYYAYEMNPNNFFPPPSPQNFTVTVYVSDSFGNIVNDNVTTVIYY